MQIRPKILLGYGRINQPLQVPISDLLLTPTYQTFITTAATAGSGTITVQNITGFAVSQWLLIGDPGGQGSEIIKIHASTAPSGSTITLASNLVFAHGPNTPVRVILFNQIEFSHAATVSGVKSVLATSDIVADNLTTNYNDTANSSGYYFARFKNSASSVFSSYSDAAPYNGYTQLSARSVIDKALQTINKKTSSVLSDDFAFMCIDDCQMECLREYQRWSFMQSFNTIIDQSYENQLRVALPTDCDDQQTTRSIYNFRMGKKHGIQWIDKEEWDAIMTGIAYTTLATSIAVSDTSIVLTNSQDFEDSGSIQIGANVYSYSANDTSTNTLTISASTTTNTAGEDVTQGAGPGLPTYYTVFNGYAYFYPTVGAAYAGRNFYMDYYKKLTQTQNDSTEIVLPDPTVVQYYLSWRFLLKLNNGEETNASLAMFNHYVERRDEMKKKEWINRKFIWKPWPDSYDPQY